MADPFALGDAERQVRDTVRAFARAELAPTAAARDEAETYDRSLFERMAALGLTGLATAESHGGAGMGTFATALALEEIAAADMGMAISLSVHGLAQQPISAYGTDDQKDRFLPRLASGEALGAFALTEPESGSDAGALALRATRDGDEYRLDGTKVWITNGAHADVIITFATVDKAQGREGIVAFIVESTTPGFRVGGHERKMGIRDTVSAELVFEDARVPVANQLGEVGDGLSVALGALGVGRIGIAAACVGLARAALEAATAYAVQRRQFGRRIADHGAIQTLLADAATAVDAARLLTWRAARLRDAGQPMTAASSMAKLFASDTAMRVTTDAVQIFGGAGYSRDNPVERYMRDAKGAQIYEGSNQIQRLIIAQQLIQEATR
jgi:alkylation response protein AidB-like acyl-CoA dehydrogenase